MIVDDKKVVYETVKSLKEIFTKLTAPKINKIYFDSLNFAFESQETFILGGSIKFDPSKGESKFFEWLQGKKVSTSIPDLAEMAKCLKSYATSIEMDNDHFTFFYEKPTGETTLNEKGKSVKITAPANITFYVSEEKSPFEKIERIENTLSIKDYQIPSSIVSLSVFNLFLSGENIIGERTDGSEKIIEIPSKKLLSLLDKESCKVSISNRIDELFRYVKVSSEIEKISMNQYFATI